MKATMSRDGERRVSFRLDFRLDKGQMIKLLAMHAATYGDMDEKLSEKSVMEMVKKQLRRQGEDELDFRSDDEIEDALDWATEQVERFWKEA
jgi:hypothetical protein